MAIQGKLKVGWATIEITPWQTVQLMGQFYERISKYVRDPLHATALALEVADEQGACERAIWVSCDLVQIADDLPGQVRARLSALLPDFDTQKLVLNATHIHTGPTMHEAWHRSPEEVLSPPVYLEWLIGRLAEVAAHAWQVRRPGGVSWALGRAVLGHNRRPVYDDGKATMYGNTNTPHFRGMEGCEDQGVELLYTWDEAGAWTGLVANVGCPSQIVEHQRFVSADFWGEVRKTLQARQGRVMPVLALTGAAGDQSPRDLVRRGRAEANMYAEEGLYEAAGRIVRAVEAALPGVHQSIRYALPMGHAIRILNLPRRMVTEAEYQRALARRDCMLSQRPLDEGTKAYVVQTLNSGGLTFDETLRARPGDVASIEALILFLSEATIRRYQTQPETPTYPVEVHALRLGDVALCTNPFELYLDYGWRIKARSQAQQTFISQLACGSGGYLPTAKAVAAEGYSATVESNIVGPEGGQILADETVAMLNGLFA